MKAHLAAAAAGQRLLFAFLRSGAGDSASPVDGVLATIQAEEGFRAKPYRDTRGVLTIGYGTNLEAGITRAEAAYLARERLQRAQDQLAADDPWTVDLPIGSREALLDMAYQLGVEGVQGFRVMLAALKSGDCEGAKAAALDSVWDRQTPARAAAVTGRLC